MNVKDIKTTLIKPYKKNAKKHTETQIVNVAESIRQFSWVQPIVVDKDYVIIIGHCRYLSLLAVYHVFIQIVSFAIVLN